MGKKYLSYQISNYRVFIEGNIEKGHLNIQVVSSEDDVLSINNLNYILSNVIEPAIPDWQKNPEIVDGTAITGDKEQLLKVIKNLWDLRKDPHFLKAIEEDLLTKKISF